jgi:hypothetical protein
MDLNVDETLHNHFQPRSPLQQKAVQVVIQRGATPVDFFMRLRLQTLSPA